MRTWQDFGIEVPGSAAGEYLTTCPECSPTRKKKKAKCLSVNVPEGVWCCHHCGWAGTLKEGGRRHAIHWAKPAWIKPDPEKAAATDLPSKVVKWFGDRGIPEDVLARNGIVYRDVYMPQLEDWTKAIGFPLKRDGELVNIKWRDGRKNFRLETGAERIPYGLDDVKGEPVWIWVEGELDKLAMEAAGFRNVVSVPTGAPTPDCKDYSSKFDFLENAQEAIRSAQAHFLCVDDDPPGHALEDELARRLGREKCHRVRLPAKDANDTLLQHGSDAIAEAVENAKPYPVKGVFEVADLSDRVERLYETGYERGVETGWGVLDDLWSVRPGEMTVITGIPNSGKSNWGDCLLTNLSKLHGWHHAIFSPENQPLEDHAARFAEKWAQQPFSDGPTPRMDRETMKAALEWANNHFFWMLPDDDTDWTLDYVLETAKALVYRKGIRTLTIDPWNEMEHFRGREQTETEYISHSLKKIRQFGRVHGVHMFVVAHPSKLYKDKDGNYGVPTPYDISGSAHWRNKADNCLAVWRDFSAPDRAIEVHVQKVRFRQIGRLGVARLRYEPATGTYRGAA